jgi:putative cell wall-binding protein
MSSVVAVSAATVSTAVASAPSAVTATSASAASVSAQVDRLAGSDRYGTTAQISAQYAAGVPSVYIATGESFPDALAAGAAAGAASPVLLVAGGTIPVAVQNEVARLKPAKVILVGGSAVLPDSVGVTLAAAAGGSWERLAGKDRFETAQQVSAATFSPGVATAYLVSGLAFPDALTASALGALQGSPVLLTSPSQLPDSTIAELTRLQPKSIVVLGGTSAVSDAVVTAAKAYSESVSRVSGTDRFATNAGADAAVPGPVGTLVVASGANFPDALSGAALAGHLNTAMLLVGPGGLSAAQQALVARLAPGHIDVLGGTKAVSDQTLNAVLTAAGLPTIAITDPTPPSTSGDYALSYSGAVGAAGTQLIRWNPCAPIGWRLNAPGASTTLLATINTEFGQLAAATGMTFRYDGTTTFVPRSDNISTEPDDLVLTIAARTSTDFFDGSPGAIGYGGWDASTDASGNWKIVKGYAILDQAAVAELPAGVQAGQSAGTLVLHELGHAVGLRHAAQPTEIMYPALNSETPQTYSADDRMGLTLVGKAAGCIS